VVLNLIPVFGVASAVVFLGEGMTARDALGALLIGSSVLYFAIADHREATAQVLGAEQMAPLRNAATPAPGAAGQGGQSLARPAAVRPASSHRQVRDTVP
jgi:peptide subunit release factor 1 (eRF1)